MPKLAQTGGAYAEDYARVISFFTHLSLDTQEPYWRELAEQVALEAIDKLYTNGLFRGHPAKPYYEATNGVGLLLQALLDLDSVSPLQEKVF
jgi:hypothetical protein